MTDEQGDDDATRAVAVPTAPPPLPAASSRPVPTLNGAESSSVDDMPEFVIAMTARWAMSIESRLDSIEQVGTHSKLAGEYGDRIQALESESHAQQLRGDRHRSELEEIKSALSDWTEWVKRMLPPQVAE